MKVDTIVFRAADAWLQGVSLSDHLNDAPITNEDVKLICAGLGVAFGKLATRRADCPYARARRAVAVLGRLSNPDPKTRSYFDRYDRAADRIGTPHPSDTTEAIAWLAAGVSNAQAELRDEFLSNLAKSVYPSYQHLENVLR